MSTRIKGVALVPGVSANDRYYSADMIRQAVAQAQPRVKAGQFLMKAFHGAQDTTGFVARVDRLEADQDGKATFEAELADTSTARDVAALVRGQRPFVNGVSITGEFTGKLQTVRVAGREITTAPGLLLHGIDFTGTPGIAAARITAESAPRRRLIFESAEDVEPVTLEPTARELSAMPLEEFRGAAASYLARAFGEPRDQRPPSPWNDPDRWEGR